MYQDMIKRELFRQGHPEIDPRHIEAYMRVGHSTLDGLSKSEFQHEVEIGIGCVMEGGNAAAERCAISFGL